MRRIVVTGLGPIASVGIGKKAFWEGILNRKTGVDLVESYILKDLWEKYYIHIYIFDSGTFRKITQKLIIKICLLKCLTKRFPCLIKT